MFKQQPKSHKIYLLKSWSRSHNMPNIMCLICKETTKTEFWMAHIFWTAHGMTKLMASIPFDNGFWYSVCFHTSMIFTQLPSHDIYLFTFLDIQVPFHVKKIQSSQSSLFDSSHFMIFDGAFLPGAHFAWRAPAEGGRGSHGPLIDGVLGLMMENQNHGDFP